MPSSKNTSVLHLVLHKWNVAPNVIQSFQRNTNNTVWGFLFFRIEGEHIVKQTILEQ